MCNVIEKEVLFTIYSTIYKAALDHIDWLPCTLHTNMNCYCLNER